MANKKGLGTLFGSDIDDVLNDINGKSASGSIKLKVSEIKQKAYKYNLLSLE